MCICNHISDMYGLILFVVGTKTTHDGVRMHIIFVRDTIKDGRLAAILVVKKTWCWKRPQPFLGHAFTDVVQTWHTDNERWLTYAHHFFLEVRSKMADWRPFCYLDVQQTMSWTCIVWFWSSLAQAQSMMAYTGTSLYFAIWSKVANW